VSENFKNSCGIRQGYPLSVLLFVLSVEIMALNLRSSKDIKGITVKLPENEPNISISFIACKTSSLLLQNRVVSLAGCEILILWVFSSNFRLNH
jgi:hypothetical protein